MKCVLCGKKVGPRRARLDPPSNTFCSLRCQEKDFEERTAGLFGFRHKLKTRPPLGKGIAEWLGWAAAETAAQIKDRIEKASQEDIDSIEDRVKKWVKPSEQQKKEAEDFWQRVFTQQTKETPAQEKERLLKTLDLPATATLEEAEKAYRAKAKEAHPDVSTGSNEKMAKLNGDIARLRVLFA